MVRKWAGFSVHQDPPQRLIAGVLFNDMVALPDDTAHFQIDPGLGQVVLLFPLGQRRARAYLGWYQHMSPSRLQGLDDLPRFIKESIRTGTPADYYTGAKAAGYPNLFVMGGLQASFQFNYTDIAEAQGQHIAACIDYARRHGYQSLDATPEAEERWVQEVIEHRGKTSFNQECTPGYYNFEGEFQRRQDGNYNGGFFQYCRHLNEVRERMEANFKFVNQPLTTD